MRSAIIAVVVTGVLSSAAAANADGVKVQELFDRDGWPELVANYSPNGSRAVPSWAVCTPECGPIVATDNVYRPGPTAVGTTFQASATVDGISTTALSRPWGGRVTSISAPTLAGAPVAGQTVTPTRGTWAGGWEDDVSLLGVRACSTLAAEDCRAVNAASLQPGHPSQVTIDRAYTGWYVGAIEVRLAARVAHTAIGLLFPVGMVSPYSAPRVGQTVAAGPLSGPVTDPTPPMAPPAAPGFTPRATFRKHAVRRAGRLVVGALSCSRRCVAHITLRHGNRARTRRIVVSNRRAAISLQPGTFPRRATALRTTARFKGFAAVTRATVRLPSRPRP